MASMVTKVDHVEVLNMGDANHLVTLTVVDRATEKILEVSVHGFIGPNYYKSASLKSAILVDLQSYLRSKGYIDVDYRVKGIAGCTWLDEDRYKFPYLI